MSRGGYERITRITHRWLAIGAGGFFFLSLVTGLLWADARFLYWDERYKEKVLAMPGPSVDSARLSVPQVVDALRGKIGGPLTAEHLVLRSDFGRLLYEVRLRREGTVITALLDAVTGEQLSPISTELARVIAAQYVRPPAMTIGAEVEQYRPRKKKRSYDAVRVRFDDDNKTEIILDRQTGEILEDEGRWRRLHFFVMQLHQLNFFGFDKTLLNVPALPLLLMGFSGMLLWAFHQARGVGRKTAVGQTQQRCAAVLNGPHRRSRAESSVHE
jgi:uncharacterized iron-regulated membrane protein